MTRLTPRFLTLVGGITVSTLVASGCWAELEPALVAPLPEREVHATELSGPTMPRLTSEQYHNVIADLLGDDIVVPSALEPDIGTGGFLVVGAAVNAVSPRGVEQYEDAAFDIASQALETPRRRRGLVACEPEGSVDDACARETLAVFARRAWRRPVDDEELDRLVGIAAVAGESLDDFYEGLSYALATVLQSPHFIYRIELGEADPDEPGRNRYTSEEMATRLSFFLWNTTPDEALLAAAERGELTTDAGLERQVRRLLNAPRARDGVRNFFSEWLELEGLDALTKDPTVFVHMSNEVGPSAREETLLMLDHHVFEQNADFRDIFTTRTTFLNRKLAAIYNVPAPALEGFAMTELPEHGERQGLLGHASILALQSHPTSSSATLRGVFIRETLLCQSVPTPPAGVNTAIPEPSPELPTLRDRLAIHNQDGSCASCHDFFDPIGLGLENFDGIGRFRATESEVTIDASGAIDGVSFDDPVELGHVIANHPALPACVVRNVFRYATHQVETDGDRGHLAALTAAFEAGDYRFRDLLFEMAMSDGFRRPSELPSAADISTTGGDE